jgi:hypothetical protein
LVNLLTESSLLVNLLTESSLAFLTQGKMINNRKITTDITAPR